MCGFLVQQKLKNTKLDVSSFEHALSLLNHRGPDAQNIVELEKENYILQLGHTRLSIIELSEDSNQPMASLCGRYTIVFNGEIYNYLEILDRLDDEVRAQIVCGDTSVLVNLWSKYQEKCLNKLVGMFSFVIHDKVNETLTLVTDGFGIKPMYYHKEKCLISSELSPIVQLLGKKPSIALDVQQQYVLTGEYDRTHRSFYENINRLPPGHIMKFCLKKNKFIDRERWYYPSTVVCPSKTVDDFCEELRTVFLESVRIHLRSDVPLGFALSGGLDSSTLVAAARYLNPKMDINAISYIADDRNLSEENWVDYISKEKNVKVHKIRISSNKFIEDLPDLVKSQGEPFGSSSVYAQYAIFRHANKLGYKVMIEGQGADELLLGYTGYPHAVTIRLLAQMQPIKTLEYLKNWSLLNNTSQFSLIKTVLARLINPDAKYYLKAKHVNEKYKLFDKIYSRPFDTFDTKFRFRTYLKDEMRSNLTGGSGLIHLLRHSDRNSMNWSVESRVPFLNVRLANMILSANQEYLYDTSAHTKVLMRKAFADFLPKRVVNRNDKIGFETPEKKWLGDNITNIKSILNGCENLDGINIANFKKYVVNSLEGKIPYDWMSWRILNLIIWRMQNEI